MISVYIILFKMYLIDLPPGLLKTRDPYPLKPGPVDIPAGFTGTGMGTGGDTRGLPVPFTSVNIRYENLQF